MKEVEIKDLVYHGYSEYSRPLDKRYTLVVKFGYDYIKHENSTGITKFIANIGLATLDQRKYNYNKKFGVKVASGRAIKSPILKIKAENHNIDYFEDQCKAFRNLVKQLVYNFEDWLAVYDDVYDTNFIGDKNAKKYCYDMRIGSTKEFKEILTEELHFKNIVFEYLEKFPF